VVDEALDTLAELMSNAPRSQDKEEMKNLRQDYQAITMTQYASFLESFILKNESSVYVGKTITAADMSLNALVKMVAGGSWDYIDADFFNAYPGILACSKLVDENEKVAAYYASK
jgi:hypothetical protein